MFNPIYTPLISLIDTELAKIELFVDPNNQNNYNNWNPQRIQTELSQRYHKEDINQSRFKHIINGTMIGRLIENHVNKCKPLLKQLIKRNKDNELKVKKVNEEIKKTNIAIDEKIKKKIEHL